PKVVASYSVICDMVEKIGADKIDSNCLIDYDQDPHTYEAKPSDRKAIEDANAVFYAGLNFEPSIVEMAEATQTPAPKIALHEEATANVIQVEEEGVKEPDPHVWHDISNGKEMVRLIGDTLGQIDPDNADTYKTNAQKYNTRLDKLDTWIKQQIALIPEDKRRLVTTHDAMSYYARAYGLTVEGTLLGVSPEEQPTATQVKKLSDEIKSKGVPTVFAELTANDKVLKVVAKEAGVEVTPQPLIADGIGAKGTPEGSYTGMIEYNTCIIVESLSDKECQPFEDS
ncbi:MAG: zinc ABC transporter solute-binding protein, partial [Sphaerospermopsis sp. SIO1G2]|nr:zinc ABC transporter solute-binding protein [Sphaerospermopsis sp. SIO1G2]